MSTGTRGLIGTLLVLGLSLLSACGTAPAKDYQIAFTASTLSLFQGASGDSTLVATRTGGYNEPETALAVEGSIVGLGDTQIDYGVTKINDTSVKITFVVGANVPAGSYPLSAKVTTANLSRTAKITIQVKVGSSVANPTNLTATGGSSTSIDLAWDAVTGATGYSIEQKVGASFQALGNVTTAGATIDKLAAQTTYTFRIKTLKGTGSSSGVEVTATTP